MNGTSRARSISATASLAQAARAVVFTADHYNMFCGTWRADISPSASPRRPPARAWYVRPRTALARERRPTDGRDDDRLLPDHIPDLARRGDRPRARAGDHGRRAEPGPAARHQGGAAGAFRRRSRDDQRGDPPARDARHAHGAARAAP